MPEEHQNVDKAHDSAEDANQSKHEERAGHPLLEPAADNRTPAPTTPTLRPQDATSGPTTPLQNTSAQGSPRPRLQTKATTALSLTDVHTAEQRGPSRKSSNLDIGRVGARRNAELDDDVSIRSGRSNSASLVGAADVESLLEDILDRDELTRQHEDPTVTQSPHLSAAPLQHDQGPLDIAFGREFEELRDVLPDGSNEEELALQWRSKLKHFMILSSAGKPIYSRHGDDQLISSTIGVFQTIISTFQGSKDILKSFTAGATRFCIISKGHLHLVAITRFKESEAQLISQLDALYMQILSTLTLPNMEKMFLNRPSTDLRRPLQGTEALLSALADGFTRGSPSNLLSALECLNLRKTHRRAIEAAMIKVKCPNLLYGLVVANRRLVSVLRPKKHSLHPGDLQLIFNMLFEADSVRAGGGENWIPLCLPGFNNTGYIYMYVKFRSALNPRSELEERPPSASGHSDEIATVLISPDRESFFELKQMGDDLINELEANGSLPILCAAIGRGRPLCADLVPGLPLAHFLYKSRSNVQFTMPSPEPHFKASGMWRRLMSLYAELQSIVHNRTTHLKVYHSASGEYTALAWTSPIFELYCVASTDTPGSGLAQAASKIVQWAHKEEERLFIIGGAVF